MRDLTQYKQCRAVADVDYEDRKPIVQKGKARGTIVLFWSAAEKLPLHIVLHSFFKEETPQ